MAYTLSPYHQSYVFNLDALHKQLLQNAKAIQTFVRLGTYTTRVIYIDCDTSCIILLDRYIHKTVVTKRVCQWKIA